MKALPDIPSGPESWKRFSAGVLEALRARTPLRSPTCEIDENVDGFMPLPRLPPTVAVGAAADLLPLEPFAASEEGTPKIGVTIGTFGTNAEYSVGAAVPLIDTTRIDADPAPRLTVAVGDILLYLKITVDSNGLITEVKVQKTASANPPSPTLYTIFYVRLCTMQVTAPAQVTLGTYELGGSQSFELCGGSNPLWSLT